MGIAYWLFPDSTQGLHSLTRLRTSAGCTLPSFITSGRRTDVPAPIPIHFIKSLQHALIAVALERSHYGQSFHILVEPSWGKSPCFESGICTLAGLENSRSQYRVSRLLRDGLRFKSRCYQVLRLQDERHLMGHKDNILLKIP